MSTSRTNDSAKPEEPGFDEAFLERVDRAVLLSKQRDPYRLDQVHRALEQEAYLAAIATPLSDGPPRRNASTATSDINQGTPS
ncbi:hypothetical protein VHAB30_46220 [Variovorax boronicumulans]|nr:hypothetical protein VHAB30_46220 [Variovorax boronicumulans]